MPSTSKREARSDSGTRRYDFGNTPVIVTHRSLNGGEPLLGTLTGEWFTESSSEHGFSIARIRAAFVVPSFWHRERAADSERRVNPGYMPVVMADFELPPHLAFFGPVNRGSFDRSSGTYGATLGLAARLAFAAPEPEPSYIALKTIGDVHRDGSLTVAGVGVIVRGPMQGTYIGCGHPTAPPSGKKKICPATTQGDTGLVRCQLDEGHAGQHMAMGLMGDYHW